MRLPCAPAPNHVWSTDITYIPLARGFLYLTAVIDWHSRLVLSGELSNSMEVGFCLRARQQAFAAYGKPLIFNTDQGSQFTSAEFVGALQEAHCRISWDGKGRATDNAFIERLWRSVKHKYLYLHPEDDGRQVFAQLETYFDAGQAQATLRVGDGAAQHLRGLAGGVDGGFGGRLRQRRAGRGQRQQQRQRTGAGYVLAQKAPPAGGSRPGSRAAGQRRRGWRGRPTSRRARASSRKSSGSGGILHQERKQGVPGDSMPQNSDLPSPVCHLIPGEAPACLR